MNNIYHPAIAYTAKKVRNYRNMQQVGSKSNMFLEPFDRGVT